MKIKTNKKLILVSSLVIIAVVFAGVAWSQRTSQSVQNTENNQIVDAGQPGVDSTVSDEIKDKVIRQEEKSNQPPPTGANSVTPLITFANQVGANIEAAAYVPGISESGGNCTLTAKQGSLMVNKTVVASQNANSTDCAAFVIPRNEFQASGIWSIEISYLSSSASGTSEPWDITLK